MNEHMKAGIAQVVFYIPATAFMFYIGVRCWTYGPKLVWILLIVFATIRLAGGALMIAYENDRSNITMMKTIYTLVSVSLPPLLMAFNRLAAKISTKSSQHHFIKWYLDICNILLLIAIVILAVAGSKIGKPEETALQTSQSRLALIGFLIVFVVLVLVLVYLYLEKGRRIRLDHRPYLHWMLLAIPPMAVRTAYAVIGAFHSTGDNITISMWSPLFGSAIAYALMALLPEFIVLAIFMYLGHYRIKTCRDPAWVDDRPPRKTMKENLNGARERILGSLQLVEMGRGGYGPR